MDCDRVFMVLTKGPFPMGDVDDEALENHLLSCESCRRFAMALQPTLELFEDESETGEKDNLPAYWGRLISADEQTDLEDAPAAVQTGTERDSPGGVRFGRDRSSRDQKPSGSDPKSRWPLAIAFIVGIVFCMTSLEWLANSSLWSERTMAGTPARTADAKPEVRTEMASITPLANPTVCPRPEQHTDRDAKVPEEPSSAQSPRQIAAAASQEKECCTKCHHADGSIALAKTQTSQILLTCNECH